MDGVRLSITVWFHVHGLLHDVCANLRRQIVEGGAIFLDRPLLLVVLVFRMISHQSHVLCYTKLAQFTPGDASEAVSQSLRHVRLYSRNRYSPETFVKKPTLMEI
ncbi:zona occludens toxin (predicted ATPase) [Pararhizobium capsulatum DSM 1112]|uniref:Zona occludens toxin (Predicted ATPase) n=1 Tax=Pararhizobium capsulatum DSM 1112 TaxID=1121113 RepID=A0ABU0BQV5_9HYPH|nr:zona occludens toxin (predicted ATPase) [Pararhizobium capsulatum DSM 1112]